MSEKTEAHLLINRDFFLRAHLLLRSLCIILTQLPAEGKGKRVRKKILVGVFPRRCAGSPPPIKWNHSVHSTPREIRKHWVTPKALFRYGSIPGCEILWGAKQWLRVHLFRDWLRNLANGLESFSGAKVMMLEASQHSRLEKITVFCFERPLRGNVAVGQADRNAQWLELEANQFWEEVKIKKVR